MRRIRTPYFAESDLLRCRTRFVPPQPNEPHIVYDGDPKTVLKALEGTARLQGRQVRLRGWLGRVELLPGRVRFGVAVLTGCDEVFPVPAAADPLARDPS